MSVDTAFRVFSEANPVPDPAVLTEQPELEALLAATAKRSTEMQTQEPVDVTPSPRPPRRNLILAVAAIAVAVLVGVVILLPGDDGQVAETTPTTAPAALEEPDVPTTLSPDEATLAANQATLDDMIEARNSGEFDAWVGYFADRAEVFASSNPDDWMEWQRAVMAANEQWAITGDCSWPSLYAAHCEMTLVNDFQGPAGIFYTVPEMIIAFGDDGKIVSIGANDWQIAGDPGEFNMAFDSWFATAHPEVWASTTGVPGEDGLPDAGSMSKVLPYLDEFLAQSDVYPLAG